jgi:hypothetical protein
VIFSRILIRQSRIRQSRVAFTTPGNGIYSNVAQESDDGGHCCSLFTAHFTCAAIQAEVSKLWTLIELVLGLSEFGDDNREAIEVQLGVLSDSLTLAETTAEFDDGFTEAYVVGVALIAVDWLWKAWGVAFGRVASHGRDE